MKKQNKGFVRINSPPTEKKFNLKNNFKNLHFMKTQKTLVIALFFFTFLSNAQITKGNWMVGGSGNFNYSKTDAKTSTGSGSTVIYSTEGNFNLLLNPNIGYFIKDKFCLGLKINFYNGFSDSEPFKLKNSNIALSPFVRYYFLKVDKNYNLFVEPSYNFYTSNNVTSANGLDLKTGIVFFLNSSVGIETSLTYAYSENDKFKNNSVFFGVGFQIHLEKEN